MSDVSHFMRPEACMNWRYREGTSVLYTEPEQDPKLYARAKAQMLERVTSIQCSFMNSANAFAQRVRTPAYQEHLLRLGASRPRIELFANINGRETLEVYWLDVTGDAGDTHALHTRLAPVCAKDRRSVNRLAYLLREDWLPGLSPCGLTESQQRCIDKAVLDVVASGLNLMLNIVSACADVQVQSWLCVDAQEVAYTLTDPASRART